MTLDKTYYAKDKKGKLVLCVSCKKPIHINDFGAVTKEGMWHNKLPCLLDFAKKHPIEVSS